MHDFQLKTLSFLQNFALLSCATLILLQVLYDRENCPNKSNNTKSGFPDHFPAVNCHDCATVDVVKKKREREVTVFLVSLTFNYISELDEKQGNY